MAVTEIPIKIKVDGKEVDVAKTSMNDFNKLYSETQQKLNSLPIGSEEWKKLNSELSTADKTFKQTMEIASMADGKFKSLKVQIRQTTVAMQEAEDKGDMKTFNKLKNDLDDLNDKFEITQLKAMKFTDALATLPGVAGFVGQSFQGLDKAFKLIVANPLVATIGALVGLFLALKESLSRTEEGTQKLAKIGEFLERVMNGLFAIIEPLANILVDFVIGILESKDAMKVLGQVVGVTAGILAGAFNIVKTLTFFVVNNFINAFKTAAGVLSGFGDILAGVFTFDFDRIKKGVNAVKNTVVTGFNNTVDNVKETFQGLTKGTVEAFSSAYDAAEKSFEKGFKRQTKRQKELSKQAQEEAERIKKAKQDEINANEALQQSRDELDEAKRKKDRDKLKELQNQQNFLDKTYNREVKRIEDLLKLETEGTKEYKDLVKQKNDLDTKYTQDSIRLQEQITQAKKEQYDKDLQNYQQNVKQLSRTREASFTKEKNDLDLKFAEGKISQLEYNLSTKDLEVKQSQDRLNNLKNDFQNEQDFFKLKFEEGLIDRETYNNELNRINTQFAEQEFVAAEAVGQSQIEQQKFLSQTLLETKQAEKDAIIELEQTKLDAISTLGSIISQLAGDNKGLAIMGLLIEQAASVAEVLSRSAKTKADLMSKKAIYMSLLPNPITAPIGTAGIAATSAGLATNTIGTVTSLASIAVAIGTGIAKISGQNSKEKGSSGGGLQRGMEKGGLIGGRRHAQGGTMIEAEQGEAIMTRGAVTLFSPLLSAMNQMGGGTSFNRNALMTSYDAPTVDKPMESQEAPVFKTYVVSNELTTEQERQARLKNLSTL